MFQYHNEFDSSFSKFMMWLFMDFADSLFFDRKEYFSTEKFTITIEDIRTARIKTLSKGDKYRVVSGWSEDSVV